MIKCREVMTQDPVCCLASDRVATVAELMRAHDIGAVPVVNDPTMKQLIGIVTDRDLALRVVSQGRDIETTTVAHVMTPNPWASSASDDVEDVLRIMAQHQVRRVPITVEDGQLVGIIAQADVATRLHNPPTTAAVIAEISQPA
ncbi:MAG: CBS domain-containing protein [Chloroflexi bacterium]|nr:CBS domain-containing protein [Chloroflexota bacterium]